MKKALSTFVIMVLVLGTLSFTACTQGGGGASSADPNPVAGPTLDQNQLSGHNYKIANGADLAKNISVPTVKSVGKSLGTSKDAGAGNAPGAPSVGTSSSAGSTSDSNTATGGNIPASVVFNTDGTFKMTYADDSYFVGGWKIVDGKLTLTIAGDTATFDTQFPSADTIALLLQKATGASTGGSSAGITSGDSGYIPSQNNGAPNDAATTDLLSKVKGTWCFDSGDKNIDDNTIASFMQTGQDVNVLLFFNTQSDMTYEPASLSVINPDSSFSMSYYMSNGGSKLGAAKYSVDGDVMTVNYGPLKKATLKRISNDEAECPGLKPVAAAKTPLILWLCMQPGPSGVDYDAHMNQQGVFDAHAGPGGKERFVLHFKEKPSFSYKNDGSPYQLGFTMSTSPQGDACHESDGTTKKFDTMSFWRAVEGNVWLSDTSCGNKVPSDNSFYNFDDFDFSKHDTIIIYPVKAGSASPLIKDAPPPACNWPK